MLELRQIRKQFDGKVVLDGIDLEIRQGEIVSMLGLSGSGNVYCGRDEQFWRD